MQCSLWPIHSGRASGQSIQGPIHSGRAFGQSIQGPINTGRASGQSIQGEPLANPYRESLWPIHTGRASGQSTQEEPLANPYRESSSYRTHNKGSTAYCAEVMAIVPQPYFDSYVWCKSGQGAVNVVSVILLW